MIKKLALLLTGLGLATVLLATHNRAGEITYVQIGDLTIRATITTYTKTSSIPADRDSLDLYWGDGTFTRVARSNGNGFPLDNDVKLNFYTAEHTYPGRATYTLSMMDPNRNGGILNVNPPNSESVPFYLETTFTFLNPQFQGTNNSPVLLQPPLDFGCVGKRFIHNPNAFDSDGDSLSYELIIPFQDSGMLVPNYSFPNQIAPGPNNQISLNEVTGDFVWDAPQVAGEYNIAFRIYEYRNGQLINTMIRDMQILVFFCKNEPPVIESPKEFCVVAGEVLRFEVQISDPNSGDLVKASALGGPFSVSDPAVFLVEPGFQQQPLTAVFEWQTTCNHIFDQYYSVVFKAVDNHFDTTGLATLQTVRIKVVGPPPRDVQGESFSERIRVSWEMPYACEFTADNYFRGFSVWRREGSNQFPVDTCTPGLDNQGYTQVGFDVSNTDGSRYFFDDENVERGKTYCYRVLGEFARSSFLGGNPFNRVSSLPSEEACVQLNRDIPLLTNVSVQETDVGMGIMELRWLKPLANALDTVMNPGPYRFQLMRAPGFNQTGFQEVPGASFVSSSFGGLQDTMHLDLPLNTVESSFTYRVDFYSNGADNFFDSSPTASSVFLDVDPTNEANLLTWEYEVPWDNFAFEIYRRDPGATDFDLVATTAQENYKDGGLSNGSEYCYYIRALGSYGVRGIPDPLFNLSQRVCAVPIDDMAPCAPVIEVSSICENATTSTPENEFKNTVTWNDGFGSACLEDEDIVRYNIYYSVVPGGSMDVVATVAESDPNVFIHQPPEGIAGCYAVTAIDTSGNESELSEIVCISNCPFYELPNAFTPNGDGQNDLFRPFPYRFVDRIELVVFNRWGAVVFETTDPDINWDGTNLNGKLLADGVYHYVCKVHEETGEDQGSTSLLKGYIELIKGTSN